LASARGLSFCIFNGLLIALLSVFHQRAEERRLQGLGILRQPADKIPRDKRNDLVMRLRTEKLKLKEATVTASRATLFFLST
jgi:hypothetical protein